MEAAGAVQGDLPLFVALQGDLVLLVPPLSPGHTERSAASAFKHAPPIINATDVCTRAGSNPIRPEKWRNSNGHSTALALCPAPRSTSKQRTNYSTVTGPGVLSVNDPLTVVSVGWRNRATLDLTGLADRRAADLSAGQKRRLGLARLLVTGRKVWLMDEPTVSLDAASVALFGAMLRGHLAAGGASIVATHIDLGLPEAEVLDLTPFRAQQNHSGAFDEAFL